MTEPIAGALFGQTRRNVLALLFGHPDDSFYLRQIVRASGSGTGAVQRELAQLTRAGLIQRKAHGRQIYFAANPHSPVFEEVRSLIAKTSGVADVIQSALLAFAKRKLVRLAFIYGSFATGKQGPRSDVDLMIIGGLSLATLLPVLRPLQEKLGREINPTIYPVEEFRQKHAKRTHFIRAVLARPKVMLIGDDDDLEELVGEPLDHRARGDARGDRGSSGSR